jgi:hypothetical protein
MYFREFKPRKSKYGFQTSLSLDILDVSELILMAIGKPDGKTWFIETNTNMGASELKIYIQDTSVYERLKAAIEAKVGV